MRPDIWTKSIWTKNLHCSANIGGRIAALNGQEVKLVKVQGEFPWHHHEHEDEFFIVWRGRFRVEFRDRVVALEAGECVVVPHGVEHRTCADEEAEILCFEPAGTIIM